MSTRQSAAPLNILLITSDQHRWDAMGTQNPILQTPNLDRLAHEGILFERAYTCNPVCTPARCSILTGHYPSRHGCYCIGNSLPLDYPTVPGVLAQHNVHTSLIGKAHFQVCANAPLGDTNSMEAPPRSMDLDFFRRWTGPYFGFSDVRLAISHTKEFNCTGMHYGAWLADNKVDTARYFGHGQYEDFGTWDIPEEFHNSTWTANETISSIDRARESGKPFFLWSSFQDPHNPCVAPEPWASMYRPEDMPDYRFRPGEFDDKPPFYARTYQELNSDLGHPDLLNKPWYCFRGLKQMDPASTRKLAAIYFGMVSLMDKNIGRILQHLDRTGLAGGTVVVFTTDHGDYLGNHGLWWKGLPAYDDAQRIPFLVRHPGCRTPGKRSAAMQSLVDIPRTALSILGTPAPAGQQGVDQSAAWSDANASARDWALCEYRPTESAFMQKTFVHDRWKLVVYHEPTYGELYDLQADPDQYRNLFNDPAHAAVRHDLLLKFIASQMEVDGTLRPRVNWA